jgi:hypothetical protein
MSAPARLAAVIAVVVAVVATVGVSLITARAVSPLATRSPGTPSVVPSPSAVDRATEKPIRLPGTTYSPAGVYRWEGGIGARVQMHRFDGPPDDDRESALVFEVGSERYETDCLARREGQSARPVRVAGWDGVVIEPYDPPVVFGAPKGGEVTRAHALAVEDRMLCVFVTWDGLPTDEELEAAARVLDSLRVEPLSASWIRVTFTLDEGWDTG